MAVKWTSARNERLLLLVVQDIKVDKNKLAKAWGEQFGDDDFQPTARAISEQFTALKKKAGGKTGLTPSKPRNTTMNKTASTPKKPSTKSIVTPSKRKKSSMSDESSGPEDDDDDSELNVKDLKVSSRASLARTKKVPKRYQNSDSEDDKADDESDEFRGPIKREDADGDEIHVAAGARKPNMNGGVGLASKMSGLMAKGHGERSEAKNAVDAEMEDDSDVSDFVTTIK